MTEAMKATSAALKTPPGGGDDVRFPMMDVTKALIEYHDTIRASCVADRETIRSWIGKIQEHHNL